MISVFPRGVPTMAGIAHPKPNFRSRKSSGRGIDSAQGAEKPPRRAPAIIGAGSEGATPRRSHEVFPYVAGLGPAGRVFPLNQAVSPS